MDNLSAQQKLMGNMQATSAELLSGIMEERGRGFASDREAWAQLKENIENVESRMKAIKDVHKDMLPDELREMIVPRRIVQTMDGERLESEDKLWLPSFTEMFGKEGAEDWAPADTDETQLELFSTERSRVKERPGNGTWWYWLRSPYGSYSTYLCFVYSYGYADYYNASYAFGVAFGFYL